MKFLTGLANLTIILLVLVFFIAGIAWLGAYVNDPGLVIALTILAFGVIRMFLYEKRGR